MSCRCTLCSEKAKSTILRLSCKSVIIFASYKVEKLIFTSQNHNARHAYSSLLHAVKTSQPQYLKELSITLITQKVCNKKKPDNFVKASYPGPGSNRHELPHWCLRPARLPIPPPGQIRSANVEINILNKKYLFIFFIRHIVNS